MPGWLPVLGDIVQHSCMNTLHPASFTSTSEKTDTGDTVTCFRDSFISVTCAFCLHDDGLILCPRLCGCFLPVQVHSLSTKTEHVKKN